MLVQISGTPKISKGRICLVTPPSGFLLDQRVFVSLGILKIGAVLEQAGWEVDHLDLTGVANYEEAAADYKGCELFAITATTPQIPAAVRIRKVLRGKAILGGPHPTLVHAAVKRGNQRALAALDFLMQNFDTVVAGDGEKSIFRAIKEYGLIDADDPKSDLWVSSKEFSESPLPARHLVDMPSYHYTVDGEKATSAVFQLGCPFECGFCGGRFSPMLRRIRSRTADSVVSEMLSINQKYDIKGLMCYDDQTEILTQRGFIRFSDLQPEEEMATLRNGALSFEAPARIIRRPYSGPVVSFKNKSVDLLVTPEHGMWVKPKGESYKRSPASDLASSNGPFSMLQKAAWTGEEINCFSIPKYVVKYLGRNGGSPKVRDGERSFPAALWVQFMAWYLAEGSCYRPKVRNGRGYRICIKQQYSVNARKVEEIKKVLDALGFKNSYSSDQFHIDSKDLYEYLKQFGRSYDKHVPVEFKKMGPDLARLFVDTYIQGDGNISKAGQKTITSYSKRMRDDLQELAIKAGYWASVSDKHHRVLLSEQKDVSFRSIWRENPDIKDVAVSTYDGDVHCVTVDTGVILVRRNGKAVWCGNCYDDELNVNKGLVELCRKIKSTGIDWRLRGFVKAELFTDEQAEAMYDAGFRWLLCGFESAHPRILKNINKKASLEDNTRMLRTAHKHGLKVKALMSFGHPGESEETILATRDWLLAEKPDDFDATVITTYPGTPYWDNAVLVEEPVYRYEFNGDALYMENTDPNAEVGYYKGKRGEYKAFVWTDFLTSEKLVQLRDSVEEEVRTKLGIPYPAGAASILFEHSMGQHLPPSILKMSTLDA